MDGGESGRLRRFHISDIKDRAYKLDITWLKDDSLEDSDELPEPQDLAAACSGRLTADWRHENADLAGASAIIAKLEKAHEDAGGHKQGNAAPPTDEAHDLSADDLPGSWAMTELRSAVSPDRPITYGMLKPGPDTPGGIPYIRVADAGAVSAPLLRSLR